MSKSDLDGQITKLFEVVKKQKEEVEKAEKSSKQSWFTNCSFKTMTGSPVNIQVAQVDTVIKCMADLLIQSESYLGACKLLGVSKEFRHDGYSVEDWTSDFKKRIAVVELSLKKAKLKELESRLYGIVSPEQKREMELKLIMQDVEDITK